jgi:rhamnose transport system permease protein
MTTTALRNEPHESVIARLRNVFFSREGILFIILIGSVLFLSTRSDKFLTVDNLLNQVRLGAEVALIALPMTLIIITGGIDLSVGATFGLTAVMIWFWWDKLGLPFELAVPLALAVSVICGAVNGLFIVRVGVPPLIMTLATLALYRGMALGISQARQARGIPDPFDMVGQYNNYIIPAQAWIVLISVIIVGIILARTPFGRSIYAIGNNELGARFSGIPVDRYKLIIYTFSGFMAGLAAYIFVSRVSTTRSDMGTGLELDAIAAVVLGGTSITGGTGNIWGTAIGLILIQLLKNGLALGDVKGDATIVVVGTVLILSILLNTLIQRRRSAA